MVLYKTIIKKIPASSQYLLLLALCFLFTGAWRPFSGGGDKTHVNIDTLTSTNQGLPFYIFFKEVDKGEFLKHEYQHIVKEAFPFSNNTPDLEPAVIFPGNSYKFILPRKQIEKPLGIYVLYTQPGDDWKYLATASNQVNLVLGDREILKSQMK